MKASDTRVTGKASKISSVVAALCILVYIAAIAFGAVRIILNMSERRVLAENEFYDLADRATSSSVFLGFMSEAYHATIRDFLISSETLLGIIISGSDGEYSFEREPGSGIIWAGDSPRFKTGAWISNDPLYLPLGIDGQRNVTIRASYDLINHTFFQRVLRETLFLVLSALIIAFSTFLLELKLNRSVVNSKPEIPVKIPDLSLYRSNSINSIKEKKAAIKSDKDPRGLYMPRGNIGWDSYINDRLSSELHRCASFEQDLVLLVIELKHEEKTSDDVYCLFTDEAVNFFTMRDLIFGKGENGISIIMPNIDLELSMEKAEEFRSRLITKQPQIFTEQPGALGIKICMGLSSRSGRLIEVDRLIFEACSALDKAIEDPLSHIVAFKSDPEKYREFIKGSPKV